MPSPYELPTRWLDWHDIPLDVESLKRQKKLDEIIAMLREVHAKLERLEPGDVIPPAPAAG
jgi:hypothetical protein